MSLRIISYGAVTPGGIGVDSLDGEWPCTNATSGSGGFQNKVCLVDRTAPALARWEKLPRLRRASPISFFMLEAAQQALAARPEIDLSRTGIVASFFLGCLIYSIRFYRQFTTEGRRFASPILFPETVFNSPVSHVVAALGIGGPVYSQMGDKSCWASALRTAECWLRCGSADHVLVLGAEEFDPYELDAFQAAGWLRGEGMIPAEGAGALLLSAQESNPCATITKMTDGHGFHSKTTALQAAHDCLAEFSEEIPILPTATAWTHSITARSTKGRLLPDTRTIPTEGSTASAAWDTIRGARLIERGIARKILVPYWGLSQQFSAAEISTSGS